MKAKEIIATILVNGLTNETCSFVTFENKEDIEFWFGQYKCYCGILFNVEYLWYWPTTKGQGNLFPTSDAEITVVCPNGETEKVYLMKVE